MILRNQIICCGILFAALLAGDTGMAAEHFFTPAESPFIIAPNESVKTIELSSSTAEDAQVKLDAGRKNNLDSVLVIRLSGQLLVSKVPLRLRSRTCLVLEQGASIVATADATAKTLMEISDAELVSISSGDLERGLLDGQGRLLAGIAVKNSGKVNLDHLSIRGCGVAAISFEGRDPVLVTDASSVTRCAISDCGDGIMVAQAAGFMCLDNELRGIRRVAVTMAAPRSVIAGNDFIGNKSGIVSSSIGGVIARNFFSKNETLLKLEAASLGNLVTENRSRDQVGAVIVGGSENQFFINGWAATLAVKPVGKNNLLVNNAETQLPAASTAVSIFNPPTFTNPHTNPMILSGMGRFDLTIQGATNRYAPVDVAVAREALQQARAKHVNDFVVARMQGYFISRNPAGLELPANTCVILNGSIRAEFGGERDPVYKKGESVTQVVRLAAAGFCSFSGGTLDAGHEALHGIAATNECVAVIDGVNITGAARDGIQTKGRKATCPLFINGCTIAENGGRGVWLHVAGKVNVLGNTCVGNQQDGIDVDAYATDCNILFNVCNGNRRHGIFIEEAVKCNQVFGNQLMGNNGSGLHIWNEEVIGNTGPNIIAANRCQKNIRGISVGGRAANRTANENYFFNNICTDNRDFNWITGNSHATNNFFSQPVIFDHVQQKAGGYNRASSFFATPATK